MNPDRSNLKGVLDDFAVHLEKANLLGKIFLTNIPEIKNVFICGMGGSGIGGEFFKTIIAQKIPALQIITIKEYILPANADENSLVILSSYSGNTEETVSCYLDARKKGCRIVALSSGGRLQHLAQNDRIPFVKLPEGLQPRAALPYLLIPLFHITASYKLIPNPEKELKSAIASIRLMREHRKESIEKTARALSKKLVGKIPLIYASSQLYVLAYRWKTQFNENSKVPSFCHMLSELNHNELVGFAKTLGKYHIIFLTSDSDHERIKKRITLTKKLVSQLSNGTVDSTVISLTGNSLLTQLLLGIHLGDLTSYYLALWYYTDPSPVKVIELLKKELGHYPPEQKEEAGSK